MEFATDQYRLIKVIDRTDFVEHANLSKNLKPLLEGNYIVVSKLADNGTEFGYAIIEKGKLFIKNEFNDREILEYISKMRDPNFIVKIIRALID